MSDRSNKEYVMEQRKNSVKIDEPFLLIPNNNQAHVFWEQLAGAWWCDSVERLAEIRKRDYNSNDYQICMLKELLSNHSRYLVLETYIYNGDYMWWVAGYAYTKSSITTDLEDDFKDWLYNHYPYGKDHKEKLQSKINSQMSNEGKCIKDYSLLDFISLVHCKDEEVEAEWWQNFHKKQKNTENL